MHTCIYHMLACITTHAHMHFSRDQGDAKKDAKKDPKKDKKGGGDEPQAEEQKIGAVFIPAIEAAVQEFVAKWQVGARVWGAGRVVVTIRSKILRNTIVMRRVGCCGYWCLRGVLRPLAAVAGLDGFQQPKGHTLNQPNQPTHKTKTALTGP